VLLNRTFVGRYFYAVGSNLAAARLSGIPTGRYLVVAYTVAGVIVSIAGVLVTVRTESGEANLGGAALVLKAVAGCIIGGVALSGGKGLLRNVVLGGPVHHRALERHEPPEGQQLPADLHHGCGADRRDRRRPAPPPTLRRALAVEPDCPAIHLGVNVAIRPRRGLWHGSTMRRAPRLGRHGSRTPGGFERVKLSAAPNPAAFILEPIHLNPVHILPL
jgi:hypothetical protein